MRSKVGVGAAVRLLADAEQFAFGAGTVSCPKTTEALAHSQVLLDLMSTCKKFDRARSDAAYHYAECGDTDLNETNIAAWFRTPAVEFTSLVSASIDELKNKIRCCAVWTGPIVVYPAESTDKT